MGACYSHHLHNLSRVESEITDDVSYEFERENDVVSGHTGEKIRLRGSSCLVSMYSQQGNKGVNQDSMTVWEDFAREKGMVFCGVFDGHGPLGHSVSQYVRDNLPPKLAAEIKIAQQNASNYFDDVSTFDSVYTDNHQEMSLASWERCFVKSFKETDEQLAKDMNIDCYSSGSTGVTVIKQGDYLRIGNLGDSRAILCTRGDRDQLIPVQLTVDLKPDLPSEAARIMSCEGRIFAEQDEPDVYRIWMPEEDCPGLAMSRSFGDFCLKDYGLISVPDVFYRKLTSKDEFVLLATDGVWDVLSNSEVINIVDSATSRSIAAKMVVKRAVRAWKRKYPDSMVDDCAVICLFLKDNNCTSNSELPKCGSCRRSSKLHRHRSRAYRNEDTETVDGKVGVEVTEEWKALGGLARMNSLSNLPRVARELSRRQSYKHVIGS